MSIFVTAALAAHLLGLRRSVKVVAWVLVALTVAATIHLGWHYVVDDFGGVAIAVLALAIARALTGIDLRRSDGELARWGARDAPPGRGHWRGVWAGGLVAAATVIAGVIATDSVGLPLRDPDHVAALYLGLVGLGVVAARRRSTSRCAPARASGGGRPSRAAMAAVRRERWTLGARASPRAPRWSGSTPPTWPTAT